MRRSVFLGVSLLAPSTYVGAEQRVIEDMSGERLGTYHIIHLWYAQGHKITVYSK